MVKIRKVDAALMDGTGRRNSELSPAARERERQQKQFSQLIAQLTGPEAVFEIRLDPAEKPITIRQRLLRVPPRPTSRSPCANTAMGFLSAS